MQNYETILPEIIKNCEALKVTLHYLSCLSLPSYYLGGGCITQTVWNHFSGYEPLYGITDFDIAYFDNSDLSPEKEKYYENLIRKNLNDTPVKLDLKNQARVHLWYEEKFGFKIKPYSSSEEAISTWPAVCNCIGIRLDREELVMFSPYGLEDIFTMTVRPNKKLITEEIYLSKVNKWIKKWPELRIINW